MGTINYQTSDYITLGIKPYEFEDFIFDEHIEAEAMERGVAMEDVVRDYIYFQYECDYENVSHELEKHSFYYFHVTIKEGYYEGFTIDIENNFAVSFDGGEDKRAAQKEITELKKFLLACADMGMVACYPGWSTTYYSREETIAEIGEAIKKMREEVMNTPTWWQYERSAQR